MKRVKIVLLVILTLAAGGHLLAEQPPVTPAMLSLFTPAQVPSPDWEVQGLRVNLLYGECVNLYGLDLGVVNRLEGEMICLQAGLVNLSGKQFTGLQLGLVNYSDRVKALQVGLYNGGDDISGLQIGLINNVRIMRGCQLGLINVIQNNDIPFLPIFNCFF